MPQQFLYKIDLRIVFVKGAKFTDFDRINIIMFKVIIFNTNPNRQYNVQKDNTHPHTHTHVCIGNGTANEC